MGSLLANGTKPSQQSTAMGIEHLMNLRAQCMCNLAVFQDLHMLYIK